MKPEERGFTVVELLTTLAVISVLSAIAIIQYKRYKGAGYDRQAQTALRAVAIAEEAYFLSHDEYVSCDESTCHFLLERVPEIPQGVVLEIASNGEDFSGESYHVSGSGTVFRWNQ